ncbi:MAG TPA: hypothetical protein VGK65_11410 [Candidatus Binatia bacterium]
MLAFAARPYIKLVELISRPEVKSISTESGVNYQIELNVFWDSRPRKIYESWARSTTAAGEHFSRLPNP